MKKKVFILSGVLITIIIFGAIIYSLKGTYAGQGCCSWHGGQNYCGSDGYWYCSDGTRSASCTCNSEELTDSQNNSGDEILTLDEYKEKYKKEYNNTTDENYDETYKENNEYEETQNNDVDFNDSLITGIIVGSILFFDVYALIKINTKK